MQTGPRYALIEQPKPVINLLLVEDNPSDAFLVGSLLEEVRSAEYRPHHIRTQSEAIGLLAGQQIAGRAT